MLRNNKSRVRVVPVLIAERGGLIGFRIDGFDLKKRTDCGSFRDIERIGGF